MIKLFTKFKDVFCRSDQPEIYFVGKHGSAPWEYLRVIQEGLKALEEENKDD